MVSRRAFLSLVAGSMSAPRVAFAQPETRKVALYANVGADLTHYDVDVAGAALTKRATVTLPAGDRKSTRLNSSHVSLSRMPSSA